jgi:uncharacterized protein
MSLPSTLRDFAIFNEGEFIGEGEMARLPKLAYKTEEWIGGGMSAPVEIRDHLEKMDCEWETKGFVPLPFKQLGDENLGAIGLRFVGAYHQPDTGTVDSVEVELRGTHKEVESGQLKRGEQGSTKVMSTLTTYKLSVNGQELVFIDAINGVERFNGKDIRAPLREALGL